MIALSLLFIVYFLFVFFILKIAKKVVGYLSNI